jgi:hypothetical protein
LKVHFENASQEQQFQELGGLPWRLRHPALLTVATVPSLQPTIIDAAIVAAAAVVVAAAVAAAAAAITEAEMEDSAENTGVRAHAGYNVTTALALGNGPGGWGIRTGAGGAQHLRWGTRIGETSIHLDQ